MKSPACEFSHVWRIKKNSSEISVMSTCECQCGRFVDRASLNIACLSLFSDDKSVFRCQ